MRVARAIRLKSLESRQSATCALPGTRRTGSRRGRFHWNANADPKYELYKKEHAATPVFRRMFRSWDRRARYASGAI